MSSRMDLLDTNEARHLSPSRRRLALATISLLLPLALYTALAAIYLPQFRYQMNPDGVSYMSIAQKYLAGHFMDSINAYWSPLYCWLMMPLFAAGVEPVLGVKILALIIGAAALVGLWLLGKRLELPLDYRAIVGCALAPSLLLFALEVTTPDLLMAAVLLFYIAAVIKAGDSRRPRDAILAGAIGGVAYLAKAYALPFVLGHFLVAFAIYFYQSPGSARREILRSAGAGLAALILISGVWIACLTIKYGRPMTGSTGAYNHAYNGPGSRDHPTHREGFLPPSNDTAVSAWEDPTYLKIHPWSPFDSWDQFWHQMFLIRRNFWMTLSILGGFTPMLYAILILAFIVAASPLDPRPARPGLIVGLAVLLYPTGYFLLHTERRFLYFMCMLLLVVGAFALRALSHTTLFHGAIKQRLALLLLAATFVGYPVQLLNAGGRPDEDVAILAEQLRDVVPKGARVATIDQWQKSLFLSFRNGWRFHGEPKPGQSPQSISDVLKEQKVEYLMVWSDPKRFPFLNGRENIAKGKTNALRIYRLSPDK